MDEDDYLDEAGMEVYDALWALKKFAKWETYEEFLIQLGGFCAKELEDRGA